MKIKFSQDSHTDLESLTPSSQNLCYSLDKENILDKEVKEKIEMMERVFNRNKSNLYTFCKAGKKLINKGKYEESRLLAADAMKNYPDAPEPHNIFGIVLEKQGNHASAMRHFRAAYALDPSYAPARQNLENFGTFEQNLGCAFGDLEEQQNAQSEDKVIA